MPFRPAAVGSRITDTPRLAYTFAPTVTLTPTPTLAPTPTPALSPTPTPTLAPTLTFARGRGRLGREGAALSALRYISSVEAEAPA
jgi:hypothetical protein